MSVTRIRRQLVGLGVLALLVCCVDRARAGETIGPSDGNIHLRGTLDNSRIEFAVNDDQDAGHARRECIRGMEGIIRHARRSNPHMDIVITYFVNPEMLATIQEGKVPLTIDAHEEVARHYHVSSINLAEEVADEIAAGKLTWEKFGGITPGP